MPKYIVQSPIQHDGTRLEVGETVELSAKDASQMIALGALAPEPPAKPGKTDSRKDDKKAE